MQIHSAAVYNWSRYLWVMDSMSCEIYDVLAMIQSARPRAIQLNVIQTPQVSLKYSYIRLNHKKGYGQEDQCMAMPYSGCQSGTLILVRVYMVLSLLIQQSICMAVNQTHYWFYWCLLGNKVTSGQDLQHFAQDLQFYRIFYLIMLIFNH